MVAKPYGSRMAKVLRQGVPKNVHAKLGIVIRQVSADSERTASHMKNKPVQTVNRSSQSKGVSLSVLQGQYSAMTRVETD